MLQSEEAFTRFIEGFRDIRGEFKYELELSEMAVKGEKSLVIEFNDIYSFDPELARLVLNNPEENLTHFNIAAFSKLRIRDSEYADQIKRVYVRFSGLPTETPLRRIGSAQIGMLVMVSGIIVRASSVQPYITKAAFRCAQCGEPAGGRFLAGG